MKLISISSWQRHLFKREAFNWSAIGIQATADRLMQRYRLTPTVSGVDQMGRLLSVVGGAGEYKAGDRQHTIEQFIVDPVSIQFQITGDTDVANLFYENLLASIEDDAQTKIDRSERLITIVQ